MSAESCYIQLGSERLHYLKTGSGKKLLLAFHGYGRDAQSMLAFAPHLEREYTCLFFDLPHHGASHWGHGSVFSAAQLSGMVSKLMKEYGVEKISLLGYSIGGRICLSIIHEMVQCVERVTLLANDGLRIDPYYRFFTRNAFGKKLFRLMLTRPGAYLSLLSLLHKGKMVHEKRYKFLMQYLADEAGRKQLSLGWPSMAELVPEIEPLKKIIARHKVPIVIFMGKHDMIIPAALAHKFKKGLDTVQVITLSKGHRLFDASNAGMIAESLLH